MNDIIPYSTQYVDNDDILSVKKILKSKYLTKGNETLKFEKKIKIFVGSKYALSVINASSGLILACKALGIGKKDTVWCSATTYVSSINSALHCGAKIDLVDIDLDDYNICTEKLEHKLKLAKKNKKLPKAIVVVHLAGYPCNLEKIYNLSKKYKFKIIEDASHAFGASYKGNVIGSCFYSSITIFSFHPVKVITSAEGGMITTNNMNIYKKLLSLRENGIVKKSIKSIKDPNCYDVIDLGYNFRINEINSALGYSQVKKTKKFILKKKKIADFYYKNLKDKRIILPNYKFNRNNSWHLFIIRIDFTKVNRDKAYIVNFLKKKKIFVNTHYIPLNYLSYIRKKISNKKFQNAEKYYYQALSIPIYPHLSKKQQIYVIKNILKSIK